MGRERELERGEERREIERKRKSERATRYLVATSPLVRIGDVEGGCARQEATAANITT
jgi:hypothetical protein